MCCSTGHKKGQRAVTVAFFGILFFVQLKELASVIFNGRFFTQALKPV